ncbi:MULTISPECIES: DUF2383 domain-containing protein [Aequorivita]|uniref:DUF2383 domain-containing protein n=1 Tax=Aequorivita iocasae TaxID=2803865 RepID=A0ABX7DRR0_9FLAO|nr:MULTISPECIES: DUF2383 domain-containing protein [Aequorivita]QQX76835.1 DUF2383 domain-containing protein [Aequorivita iocasae]UCA56307.1 PA2169 family four-helix-bundle protein [Aequorivita sp. F7]
MKKKYADFDKLNRLLVACFEAEKLYYNAAQDAQTTDLKRFLNYMAVERNRMSHDISNELHSRDIEPLKQDSEKGNIDRTWQEIKEALEYFDAEAIVRSCINRDRNNIKRYDELLERRELPDSILELLEKQKYQLEWYIKQAAQQPKKSPFVEEKKEEKKEEPQKEEEGGKVINLKAM